MQNPETARKGTNIPGGLAFFSGSSDSPAGACVPVPCLQASLGQLQPGPGYTGSSSAPANLAPLGKAMSEAGQGFPAGPGRERARLSQLSPSSYSTDNEREFGVGFFF